MKPTDNIFFHECEVKFRIPSEHAYEAWERRLRSIGFERTSRQLETDFIPDTADFACRAHGLMLRFRHLEVDDGRQDIILTVKLKGDASSFQERFEYECAFSAIDDAMLARINHLLMAATGRTLPPSLLAYTPDQFDALCSDVRTIFPALRIHMQKKRTTYSYDVYHALFDTLPVGIGDYLELEAPSPEALDMLLRALMIDDDHKTAHDYGEILIAHHADKEGAAQRTGLFLTHERTL